MACITATHLGADAVGARIRKFREGRFIQSAIASAAGCSPSHISNAENGEVELSPSQLCAIAEFLKVHPLELIAGIPSPVCRALDLLGELPEPEQQLAPAIVQFGVALTSLVKGVQESESTD